MTSKTVFETDRFDLYTDKNGKFRLWDKADECNRAIRAKTEIDAYREAIDSLMFCCQMYKESRDELRVKLGRVEACFDEIFSDRDE